MPHFLKKEGKKGKVGDLLKASFSHLTFMIIRVSTTSILFIHSFIQPSFRANYVPGIVLGLREEG